MSIAEYVKTLHNKEKLFKQLESEIKKIKALLLEYMQVNDLETELHENLRLIKVTNKGSRLDQKKAKEYISKTTNLNEFMNAYEYEYISVKETDKTIQKITKI